MTPEEEGAYIRLICHDWANDGIPDDDSQLAMLSRLGEQVFNKCSNKLRKAFIKHPTRDGYLTNERLEKERNIQAHNREQRSKAGISSGKARAYKREQMFDSRSTSVEQKTNKRRTKTNSSTSSSTSLNNPPTPKGGVVDVGFENFWNAYPRKICRTKAEVSWGKLKPNAELQSKILDAVKAQCKSEQWKKDNGQFIPYPATWLNQERWSDLLTPCNLPEEPKFNPAEWRI
jgi:uncharacterized protein YdaU (DUF1376 family)